jgi:hypothetical protein
VKDAMPVPSAINTTQYTGIIEWKTSGGAAFTDDTFAAATVYKALVTLTAMSGYTFTGVAANSFTYTTATATNAVNSGTVTITFPATASVAVSNFDLTALVIAPVVTATPVTTEINSTQYTGTVAWYTNGGAPFTGGAFAADSIYKARVMLTPKLGYTFEGVAANSFTHMGATATNVANAANSGLVTITFPATGVSSSAAITVGFGYGDITITGDGSVISKSGNYGQSNLSLRATGYTDVIWYVDASPIGLRGSPVTLNAADYTAQKHSIIFTGMANGRRYSSQPITFTVRL